MDEVEYSPEAAQPGPDWLAWLTAAALLSLSVVLSLREIYSPDLGFHLRAGEWIIDNFRFPSYDLYTYTVPDHQYIDMYWLYQVVIAVIHRYSGSLGLVISNAALIGLSFYLVFIRMGGLAQARRCAGWSVLMLIGVIATALLYGIRPHVFSWLFLNLLLLVLDDYVDRKRNNLIYVPIIMLLWSNSHTLFILGWIVVGSYAVGVAWREKRIWNPLTKAALLSILVSFVNPYFARGVALPFYQFQFLQRYNVFKAAITEYASPLNLTSYMVNGRLCLFQPLFGFHLFLIVCGISFLLRLRRISLHELLTFGFFSYIGITAVKNIGYFVFAVLPWVVEGLQPGAVFTGVDRSSIDRMLHGVRRFWGRRWVRRSFEAATLGACLFVALSVVTDSYYITTRSNFRFGYQYNNLILPAKAAEFLRENKLEGRVLNDFNFGGTLIYAIPQKIFIDGRNEVIGPDLFSEYFKLWVPVDKKPMLDKYNPDIVIFPYQNAFLWVHYFTKDTSWRLVYVDELAAVYLRAGYAPSIRQVDIRSWLYGYTPVATTSTDSVLRMPYASKGFPRTVRAEYYPQREIELSTFCYYDDRFDEAVQIGLQGLMKSTVPCPEMYFNLGHYFFQKKDFKRAGYCYERFLETNADDLASDRLTEIRSKMGSF